MPKVKGRTWVILTPMLANSDDEDVVIPRLIYDFGEKERARKFWKACGSKVHENGDGSDDSMDVSGD